MALQCSNSDDVDSSSSDNNQEPPVDEESDISIRLLTLDQVDSMFVGCPRPFQHSVILMVQMMIMIQTTC